jgi:hypothetical protein
MSHSDRVPKYCRHKQSGKGVVYLRTAAGKRRDVLLKGQKRVLRITLAS